MSLYRFELLLTRTRIYFDLKGSRKRKRGEEIPTIYLRINDWSDIIQQKMGEIYIPSLDITVDECVVGYTAKSLLIITILNKPTPIGFKVWVVAQDGLFLRWRWHIPGKGLVDIPKTDRKGSVTAKFRLNPTQRIAFSLVHEL